MSDDLVKRLRDPNNACYSDAIDLHFEAADRIEALEAGFQVADEKWSKISARCEALEAALLKICDGPRDADKSYPELLAEVRIEARAALAGEKHGENAEK